MIKPVQLVILLIFPILAFSQGNVTVGQFGKKPTQQILKFGVVTDKGFESAKSLLGPALAVVNLAAPAGVSIEEAKNDKFDFIIQVTNSKSGLKDENPEIRRFSNINGDAYSIFFSEDIKAPTVVRVLWDKAMYEVDLNGKNIERSDAFTRLVVLLGHEIYGNVLYFQENKLKLTSVEFKYNKVMQKKAQLDSEINAFQKGIQFVENVKTKLGSKLSPKMLNDFSEALIREKEFLAVHEKNKTGFTSSNEQSNVIPLGVSCKSKLVP